VKRVFEPLSNSVWLLILVVIFSQGWLDLLYFEHHTHDAQEALTRRGMSSQTRAGKMVFKSVWGVGVKWLAFMGHDEGFPSTMGSLINAVGFNFFIFIVTTAYTVRLPPPRAPFDYPRSHRVRAGASVRVQMCTCHRHSCHCRIQRPLCGILARVVLARPTSPPSW
jgi:hypothetical protein